MLDGPHYSRARVYHASESANGCAVVYSRGTATEGDESNERSDTSKEQSTRSSGV